MIFYCKGNFNYDFVLKDIQIQFFKKRKVIYYNYFLLGFDKDDYLFFNVFFEIFFLKLLLLNLFLKNFVFKVGILY